MKRKKKPALHQPIPELAAALAMPPEKRRKRRNHICPHTKGKAMGVGIISH